MSTTDPKLQSVVAAGGGGGAPAAETPEQELARLRKERAERSAPDAAARIKREIEKEKLIAKFESQGMKLGSDFVVIDTDHLSDPLIVAKKPALIQWEKYTQGPMAPADRFDFVSPSIAHPTLDEYKTMRKDRAGIDQGVSNALLGLMGITAEVERGK